MPIKLLNSENKPRIFKNKKYCIFVLKNNLKKKQFKYKNSEKNQ